MCRGVGLLGVVQVVGGDQRQLELSCYPQQVVTHPALNRDAVVHQLHVIVAGAEEIAELRGTGQGFAIATEPQVGLHLSTRAAGGSDQPTRVPGEKLAIDARLVEITLQ